MSYNVYNEYHNKENLFNKEVYMKLLIDRIINIQQALKNIKNRLDAKEIDYPEFLYLENNMYQSLIMTQNELYFQKYRNDNLINEEN